MNKLFSMLVKRYTKVAQVEREEAIMADRAFLWEVKVHIEKKYPGARVRLEGLSDREISDLVRRIDGILKRRGK